MGRYPDPVFGGHYFMLEVGASRASEPVVLLVHGLGEQAGRDWSPVLATLASRHRVAVIDLPGFGHSDAPNARYTPDRYAQLLAYVIRNHLRGQADVVGHSMGGAIALALAAKAPDVVRRLVLVDVAGVLSEEAWVAELARPLPAAEGGPSSLGQLRGDMFHELVTGFAPLMPDPELALRSEGSRARMLSGDPGRIAALGLLTTNFEAWIASVRAPTLIVWGDRDTVAPLRTFEILSRRLPVAQTRVLPGVGHNPIAERPGTFATTVLHYLEDPIPRVDPHPLGARTPESQSYGTVTCRNRHGVVYTGRMDRLELDGCQDVKLRNVSIGSMRVRRSTVDIVNADIREGVELHDARVRLTVARVEGQPALRMQRSVVDLASTTLVSRGVAVEVAEEPSRLVGSVSRIHSEGEAMLLHGVRQLQPGDQL